MTREKYFVKKTVYKSGYVEYRVVFEGSEGKWITVEGSRLFYDAEEAISFAEQMEGKMVLNEYYL